MGMLGQHSAPSSALHQWLTADLLQEEAGKQLYEEGQGLLARQRVLSVREDGPAVIGVVAAGRQGPYSVLLSASGEGNVFDCQCPDFRVRFFCKHVVAVGLAWLSLTGGAQRPSVVPSSPSEDTRPTTPAALRAWVDTHQVMHAGLASVAVLRPYLPASLQAHHIFHYLSQASVFAVLAEGAMKGYLRARDEEVLKDAAWAWLRAEADRVRRGLEQEAPAPPRLPPTDERLAPLVDALLRERERVRARAVPRALEAPAEVHLQERPPRLFVSESSRPEGGAGATRPVSARVTLEPRALLEGGPGLSCPCASMSGADASCVHALTALDAVLEVLSRERSHEFNTRLAELLFVLPAQELLGALERASLTARAHAAPAPIHPVTFRLERARAGGFSLRTYVHRPTKKGGHSRGIHVILRDSPEVRAALTLPGELEALALIDAGAALSPHGMGFGSARREGWPLLIHALRALAHSPRLRLAERPDVPLRVREAPLGFTFEEAEDGTLRVRPSVEGRGLRPEDLSPPPLEPQAAEPWLLVEPEVPRVTLLSVSPEPAHCSRRCESTAPGCRCPRAHRCWTAWVAWRPASH
ncbi:SWIM zinc finger domain-containing protein [Pyxidicoccus sp. 3LG]